MTPIPSMIRSPNLLLAVFGLVLSMLVMGGGEARAQTCTAGVSALNFGTVTGLNGTTIDSTATITVTCNSTGGLFLCYHIGRGGGNAYTAGPREMSNGTDRVGFELYADAARTQIWRSTVTYASAQNTAPLQFAAGNGVTVTRTIYGRATLGTGAPGAYATDFVGAAQFDGATYQNVAPANRQCDRRHNDINGNISFDVNLTAASYCDVTSGSLDFGTHGPLVTAVTATGSLDVGCTTGTAYTVSLDDGQNAAAGQRRMRSGGNTIAYDLFTDPARTNAWRGATTVNATGNGNSATLPVYGRVPPQGAPPPGTYSDAVVITMTY